MFEPISDNLAQFAAFTVLGFCFGILYEPLRIIRLFKRQGTIIAGVQDFLFLIFAGFISFAYSMELGTGSFRIFYLAGEIFGAVIYFITIGRIVSMISNLIIRIIKFIFKTIIKYVFKPVMYIITKVINFIENKLSILYNFCTVKLKNVSKHLKERIQMVYNSRKQGKKNKGKSKNVIKAKIRTNSN